MIDCGVSWSLPHLNGYYLLQHAKASQDNYVKREEEGS